MRAHVHLLRRAVYLGMLLLVAAGPAAAQATPKKDPPPKPAARAKFVPIRDNWIVPAMKLKLRNAVEAQTVDDNNAALAKDFEDVLLARLRSGKLSKYEQLVDMVYLTRAARCLWTAQGLDSGGDNRAAGAKQPAMKGPAFALWLLKNEKVLRPLCRAMADVPRPGSAVATLHELVSAEEKSVLAYPELAVALAISQPQTRTPKEDQSSLLETFRFYTGRTRFRYDLKTLPHELLRYVVDNRLSTAERQWVLQRYGRHSMPAKTFFDIKYDWDHYRKDTPRKITSVPYTLANLHKVGGVCHDQAYFATMVCKTLGIPAMTASGEGASGVGHAWVAYFKIMGRRGAWDARTGRYREHLYYVGYVEDPARGERINDSVLKLSGLAVQLPARQRAEADAVAEAARLVIELGKDSARGRPEALQKLAVAYNADPSMKSQPANLKATADWTREAVDLDAAFAAELLLLALDRNLGHYDSWERVVELREKKLLDDRTTTKFMAHLTRKTGTTFPDYSYHLAMRLITTYDDRQTRLKYYQQAVMLWRARPDLQCRVLISVGDDYRKRRDIKKALDAYMKAVNHGLNRGDLGLKAAIKAEEILLDAKKPDAAIRIYANLLSRTQKPQKTGDAVFGQTIYNRIGKRLIALLKDVGKHADAQRIQKQIGEDKPKRGR